MSENNLRKLTDGRHLWDVEHPYYCAEAGFYGGGKETNNEYDSLDDFIDDWKGLDVDLNLVFRWDWVPEEGYEDEGDWISIHFMLQRKGFHVCNTIKSIKRTEENERKLIEFLQPHWRRLKEMWEPISWWE